MFREQLTLFVKGQLDKCNESSPDWDKYFSRMSAEEAYGDILDWILEYPKITVE